MCYTLKISVLPTAKALHNPVVPKVWDGLIARGRGYRGNNSRKRTLNKNEY